MTYVEPEGVPVTARHSSAPPVATAPFNEISGKLCTGCEREHYAEPAPMVLEDVLWQHMPPPA